MDQRSQFLEQKGVSWIRYKVHESIHQNPSKPIKTEEFRLVGKSIWKLFQFKKNWMISNRFSNELKNYSIFCQLSKESAAVCLLQKLWHLIYCVKFANWKFPIFKFEFF